MHNLPLLEQVLVILEDAKALNTYRIDVRGKTSVTDWMVIATGTSSRHTKSISQKIVDAMKPSKELLGVEGLDTAEWVLIDLGDVVVHVMRHETRELYQLEHLWETEVVADEERLALPL